MELKGVHIVLLLIFAIIKGCKCNFYDRETVELKITKGKADLEYSNVIEAEFKAFGDLFQIKLQKFKGMFDYNYSRIGPGKKAFHEKNMCQYTGLMLGSTYSNVAVSLCNGFEGIILNGRSVYAIYSRNHKINGVHIIEKLKTNLTMGSVKKVEHSKRYIETSLVIDPMLEQQYNGAPFQTAELVVNIANMIMKYLNIEIVLKEAIITNEIPFTEINPLRFGHYRKTRQLAGDVSDWTVLLFSPDSQRQSAEGWTYLKGMCSMKYSIGIVDVRSTVEETAQFLAHSIGHSLGIGHDNGDCACPDNSCIMSQWNSHFKMMWSQCSIEHLDEIYERSQDLCLQDQPKTIEVGFDEGICGDGIVNNGEQCDCGTECANQKCCNGQTCTLVYGAECSEGTCCELDTCQFKQQATLCRTAKEECDLEEYCTGTNATCPDDLYVQDGRKCNNGKSYCYHGNCDTYDKQCKELWGKNSMVSSDACFSHLNVLGSGHGHCSYDAETNMYVPCSDEDTKCGKIFCTGTETRNKIGSHLAVQLQSHVKDEKTNWIHKCLLISFDFGASIRDPGFVKDGQKCKEDHMCINNHCVHIESLKLPQKTCSGRGIVNNKGECHCDLGYAPPDCTKIGAGGSTLSGPASVFVPVSKSKTSVVMTTTTTTESITTDKLNERERVEKAKALQEETFSDIEAMLDTFLDIDDEDFR